MNSKLIFTLCGTFIPKKDFHITYFHITIVTHKIWDDLWKTIAMWDDKLRRLCRSRELLSMNDRNLNKSEEWNVQLHWECDDCSCRRRDRIYKHSRKSFAKWKIRFFIRTKAHLRILYLPGISVVEVNRVFLPSSVLFSGAFRLYDVDNDGFITRDEMYNIVDAIYQMVVSAFLSNHFLTPEEAYVNVLLLVFRFVGFYGRHSQSVYLRSS